MLWDEIMKGKKVKKKRKKINLFKLMKENKYE